MELGEKMVKVQGADAELKNCPFCGNDHLCIEVKDGNCCVICDYGDNGCGACGGNRGSISEAIEAWNRRCAPPKL